MRIGEDQLDDVDQKWHWFVEVSFPPKNANIIYKVVKLHQGLVNNSLLLPQTKNKRLILQCKFLL